MLHLSILPLLIQALHRSNWTCPMTGIVERTSPNGPQPLSLPHTLDVAHIIPHNLGQARDSLEVGILYLKISDGRRKINGEYGRHSSVLLDQKSDNFSMIPRLTVLKTSLHWNINHHNAFGRFNLWFTEDPFDVTPFAVFL